MVVNALLYNRFHTGPNHLISRLGECIRSAWGGEYFTNCLMNLFHTLSTQLNQRLQGWIAGSLNVPQEFHKRHFPSLRLG